MKPNTYTAANGREYPTNTVKAETIPVGWDDFGADAFEWGIADTMPCPSPYNKQWMTPGFLSIHRGAINTLWNPCPVCGFQAVLTVLTDDGEKWILSQDYAGFNTEQMFNTESELIDIDTDLTDEWVYAGDI